MGSFGRQSRRILKSASSNFLSTMITPGLRNVPAQNEVGKRKSFESEGRSWPVLKNQYSSSSLPILGIDMRSFL
jgi:hypothetical protein